MRIVTMNPRKFGLIFAAILLSTTTAFGQTTRSVCASGCTTPNLQTAIDASACGDIITVKYDEDFVGNFILTNTAVCSTRITIRSSASDAVLPPVGVRAGVGRPLTIGGVTYSTPDYRSVMPNIRASTGGLPAIRTATGARDYNLIGLEFLANPAGFNVVVELGVNTVAQRLASEQPRNILVDRSIISGDLIFGQKVGIDLNGANLGITNSWTENIAAIGQDAIAVRAINGSGPFLVENNFIEGAAENMIIGGDDPWMMVSADPASGATTTTATLSNFADRAGTAFGSISTLKVGQTITFLAGAGTLRYPTKVRSCGTSTVGASCTSNTITYDAIPAAPDTGTAGDVRWGEIPKGVTVRRNQFYKPLSWKNPIIGAVGTVTGTTFTSGGTLAAGTYYYRVVPYNNSSYNNNNAYGTASTEISKTTTGTTGRVDLSWPAVPNATHYRVYRGTAAGTYAGYLLATGTTSLSDTGGSLTTSSTSPPTPSKWVVKTLFELKFSTDVLIEGNILENNWGGQGDAFGQCAWIKSNSQGGLCEHCETDSVTWRNNICRNVNGFFNFLASNQTGANQTPFLQNVTVVDSLFQNSSAPPSVDNIRINGPVTNLTLNHNTFTNSARGFIYFTSSLTTPGFRATNNVVPSPTYSFFGLGCTAGLNCLDKQAPGHVTLNNVIAGASSSSNPPSNFYPTVTEFAAQFQNYDNGVQGNYLLAEGSTWIGAGTDGADLGANMSSVYSATNGVPVGTPSGTVLPPSITTVGLSNGTVGVAYTATLTVTDGTAPFIWSLPSGSLPSGLTLSTAGVISGTPKTAGTSSFTVRVIDSAGTPQQDDQPLTLTIQAAPTALNITTTTLPNATIPLAYSQTVVATGGTTPYSWTISSGALPPGLTIGATTGVISGVPTTVGTSSFSVRVTDNTGAQNTKALSIQVVDIPRPCGRPARQGLTEIAFFQGPTAPVAAFPDCATINDFWLNTSTAPAVLYIAVTATPTWTPYILGGVGSHALMSHSDTTGGTPVPGDILTQLENGNWSRFAAGPVGSFLQSQGDSIIYSTDASALINIPAANLVGSLPSTMTAAWQPDDLLLGSGTHSNVNPGGEEFGATGRFRGRKDTTGFTQVSLTFSVQTGCFTDADLRIEYFDGTTWQQIAGLVGDCSVTPGTFFDGGYVTLPTGARGQGILFRAFITDGDNIVDPSINTIRLNFRP